MICELLGGELDGHMFRYPYRLPAINIPRPVALTTSWEPDYASITENIERYVWSHTRGDGVEVYSLRK